MEFAVVGGGVIGLTAALSALDAGHDVTVYDAGVSRRASHVAAGMLGSLGEGHPGEEQLLALAIESTAQWPQFIERLRTPDVVVATDSLLVAADAADARYLGQLAEFLGSAGVSSERMIPLQISEIRARERSLSPRLQSGYLAAGEGAVDNRKLLSALRSAVAAAGGRTVDAAVDDLAEVAGDQVLVAAGLDSPHLLPHVKLDAAKGEVLRLRRRRWAVAPPAHVVRARVGGRSVYVVPRADGVVVGATQYEPADADDRLPRVAGVSDLLADATAVLPGLRDYDLVEASAGMRPVTADGLPVIERVDERIVVATGHGRNGILLAPVTAARVLALLSDGEQS